ncbi:MAG: co-chaperone GroES [Thermoplasmata archaeon]|nr:co-chaperone GroES [Thermoplasmata archaeon]
MNITMTNNNVLIRLAKAKEKTEGGIIIPERAQGKNSSTTGVVIAVGPGVPNPDGTYLIPPMKTGDTVILDEYSGRAVTIDDETYNIVDAASILAVTGD